MAGDFDVLAFPCNQFGMQEPGHNDEILNGLKYVRPGKGYTPNFRVAAKVEVNGKNEHPLFVRLKASCPPTTDRIGEPSKLFYSPIKVSDITWNFEKFLIDAKGVVRFRFHPKTTPDQLEAYVQQLVKEKTGEGSDKEETISKKFISRRSSQLQRVLNMLEV